MLESFNSSSLRRLDLAISGEWHMGTYRDWRGEARGGKEIDGEGLRKNLAALT